MAQRDKLMPQWVRTKVQNDQLLVIGPGLRTGFSRRSRKQPQEGAWISQSVRKRERAGMPFHRGWPTTGVSLRPASAKLPQIKAKNPLRNPKHKLIV